MDDSVVHLIYSNDHDLWQCIKDNVYVYSKTPNSRKIIKPGQVMSYFLKNEHCTIPDEYLTLAMSINGDPGDDVPGIKGIGPKRLLDIFSELMNLSGPMKNIFDNLQDRKPIFNYNGEIFENKYLNMILKDKSSLEIVERNLRLVSFEMISRYLDSPDRTEGIDIRRYIDKIIENDKKAKKEDIKRALENCGVMIENEALDYLYI
jgi:5'-3' exonuclease